MPRRLQEVPSPLENRSRRHPEFAKDVLRRLGRRLGEYATRREGVKYCEGGRALVWTTVAASTDDQQEAIHDQQEVGSRYEVIKDNNYCTNRQYKKCLGPK